MHGLPRISPQSSWLNGAPSWPPWVILLIVNPLGVVSGKMVVSTVMHDWSTVSSSSTPPPVTRQVTGVSQVTTAGHSSVESTTRFPFSSNTQSVPPSSLANPWALTLNWAPGHETRTQALNVADSPGPRSNGSTGTTGVVSSVQSTSAGRPLMFVTVIVELPVFRRTRLNSIGVSTEPAGSCTVLLLALPSISNDENRVRSHSRLMFNTTASAK